MGIRKINLGLLIVLSLISLNVVVKHDDITIHTLVYINFLFVWLLVVLKMIEGTFIVEDDY